MAHAASHAPSHASDHAHGHGHDAHAPTAQVPTGEKIAFFQVFLFGVGGFLLIAAAVVASIIYFGWATADMKFDREEMASKAHMTAIAARSLVLDNMQKQYSVADVQSGAIRVPIDMAIDRTVERYSKR